MRTLEPRRALLHCEALGKVRFDWLRDLANAWDRSRVDCQQSGWKRRTNRSKNTLTGVERLGSRLDSQTWRRPCWTYTYGHPVYGEPLWQIPSETSTEKKPVCFSLFQRDPVPIGWRSICSSLVWNFSFKLTRSCRLFERIVGSCGPTDLSPPALVSRGFTRRC